MALSSRRTSLLLLCGIMMRSCVLSSPAGLQFPKIRLENSVFNEDGDSLTDWTFDTDQMDIRSSPHLLEDLYALYYAPQKRESSDMDEDSEPLSKRHSDGIFTDSYSRYRKQMAVKKYLAAVLGRRYRQKIRNKGRRFSFL